MSEKLPNKPSDGLTPVDRVAAAVALVVLQELIYPALFSNRMKQVDDGRDLFYRLTFDMTSLIGVLVLLEKCQNARANELQMLIVSSILFIIRFGTAYSVNKLITTQHSEE